MISSNILEFTAEAPARAIITYDDGFFNPSKKYVNDEISRPLVNSKGQRYVLGAVGEYVGVDPATSVANKDGVWEFVEYYNMIYTNLIIADGGNLGAFVFWENNIYSQHGTDVNGNPSTDFQNYPLGTFIPNWRVDGETGTSFSKNATMVNANIIGRLRQNGQLLDSKLTSRTDINLENGYSVKIYREAFNGAVATGSTYYLPSIINPEDLQSELIVEVDPTSQSCDIALKDDSRFIFGVEALGPGISPIRRFELPRGGQTKFRPRVVSKIDEEKVKVDWYFELDQAASLRFETLRVVGDVVFSANTGTNHIKLIQEGGYYIIPHGLIDSLGIRTILFSNTSVLKYKLESEIVGRSIDMHITNKAVWLWGGSLVDHKTIFKATHFGEGDWRICVLKNN